MNDPRPTVICFGEILWDFLPRGAFPGGPAFNVRYLLLRLGEFVATPDGATPAFTPDAQGLPVT